MFHMARHGGRTWFGFVQSIISILAGTNINHHFLELVDVLFNRLNTGQLCRKWSEIFYYIYFSVLCDMVVCPPTCTLFLPWTQFVLLKPVLNSLNWRVHLICVLCYQNIRKPTVCWFGNSSTHCCRTLVILPVRNFEEWVSSSVPLSAPTAILVEMEFSQVASVEEESSIITNAHV